MNYLLLMTLSGSALFIGYICLGRIFKKAMTQCMKYGELVVILLTYVIPWVWLQRPYSRFLGFFWYAEKVANERGFVDIAEITTKEEAYMTKGYVGLIVFMVIWFLGAISLVAIKSYVHFRKHHDLRTLSIPCPDENLDETVYRLQKELGCWRRPEVVWTRVNNGTFTLGVLRPVIYLQKDYQPEELYLILKHEMVHIARGDLFVKRVMEFVSCLHWINPFVHMLGYEMRFVCESSCDERVLMGSGNKERRAYAGLLDRNRKDNKLKDSISNGLEDSDDDLEDRIRLIHEREPVKGKEKAIAISAFILLVFLDSLIAFAYPKVRHVENAAVEAAVDSVDGGNFWLYEYSEEGYNVYASPILYDEQFVTETGQIYPVNLEDSTEPCVEHIMESGYFQKHIKNDDNSCVVETYESTRCMICGEVSVDELYLTLEYDACIH